MKALMLRFLSLSLCTLALGVPYVPCRALSTDALSAAAAVLYAPDADLFLIEKDADTRRPMASTTKIMTALVAIENTDPADTVQVHADAVGVEGSSVYLTAGESVTMQTLLYALLLESANDAAAAIAYAVGGSIEGFAALMNERAAAMGLTNTHFTNPHGLHDPLHYTSARDLALMTATAMREPLFREIVQTTKKSVTLQDGESARVLCNHNKLLHMYSDAIGVKTGFTKTSGRCLVGAAERDGVLLISVTLNAPNDWTDHKKLFTAGFEALECRTLAEAGKAHATASITNGTKKSVALTNALPLKVTVPRGTRVLVRTAQDAASYRAPIAQGAHLGYLEAYTEDGKVLARVPLVAEQSIPRAKGTRK